MAPDPTRPPRDSSLLAELRRRRVFRVAGAYVFVAWILMQAGEIIFPAFELPNSALRGLILCLGAGLPLVVLFAWWIDVTPRGFRLTARLDRVLGDSSPSSGESTDEEGAEPTGFMGRSLEMIVFGVGLPLLASVLFMIFLIVSPERNSAEPPHTARTHNGTPATPFLAVLPLEDLSSAGGDGGFFARGMHEDILTHLARVPGLKLISRTSVLSYEGTTKPIQQIAGELGVNHILEGSVRRTATHVRVTAQLILAETDEPVWSDQFDAELSDIFAIQTKIARSIAQALKTEFQTAGTVASAQSVLPAAYDAFAKARDLHRSTDAGDWTGLKRTQNLYEEARRLDPNFAPTWLQLGILNAEISWFGFDPSPFRAQQARRCIDQAAALGMPKDELALAEGILAYYVDRDYGKALLLFEESSALAEGNSNAVFFRAMVLRRSGALDAALEAQRAALQMDPLNLTHQDELAFTLALAGQLEESRALLANVLGRAPNRTRAQLQKWQLDSELSGDAEAVFQAVAAVDGAHRTPQHDRLMFVAAGLSGNADPAYELLLATSPRPPNSGLREVRLARLSRFAGHEDRAAAWIERARANWQSYIGDRTRADWSDEDLRLFGLLAEETGDLAEALAVFEDRVARQPIERDLVTGTPPLWDLLLAELRAGETAAAIASLDRLASHVSVSSVPFGGFLFLDRWPELAESTKSAAWIEAVARLRPE